MLLQDFHAHSFLDFTQC